MSGINLADLKYGVIEPTLIILGLNSMTALNLVTGTAMAESEGVYLRQLSGGPALGLWQVEPATEQDCWNNYLIYQHDLAAKVRSLLAGGATTPQLLGNLPYGAAMCRLKYWRNSSPLPAPRNAESLAAYWKAVYNTRFGAGAVDEKHIAFFQEAIDA